MQAEELKASCVCEYQQSIHQGIMMLKMFPGITAHFRLF